MGKQTEEKSASALIDERIQALGAEPAIVEQWKWRGVPVWFCAGIVCTGETYKSVVKLTFAKGASLDDPAHLLNASLDGSTRRAIDIREGEAVNEAALGELLRAAVVLNVAAKGGPTGSGEGADEA